MAHIARDAHAKISSRIDNAITDLVLDEGILASKIVPSQRMGRDDAIIEEGGSKGNPALDKVLSELKSFQKPRDHFEHCEEGADLAETWNALGLIRQHLQRQKYATRSSKKIVEAVTALDKDILPSKMVPSQRMGRDVPLIEEGGDTGNPVLDKVLSDLKALQKRDFEQCEESADLAEMWNALGLIRLYMQRDAEEAVKCHEEALRIYRKKCHEEVDRIAIAVTLNDLASCYEQLHQSGRALDYYSKALQLLKEQEMADSHVHMQKTLRSISRLSRK